MRLLCWLRGIGRSFTMMFPADGCTYVEREKHENVTVIVSTCEDCGNADVSWTK